MTVPLCPLSKDGTFRHEGRKAWGLVLPNWTAWYGVRP